MPPSTVWRVPIVDELAYLTNRWSRVGTNPDGTPLEIGAITAEVARKRGGGSWLYVIDTAVGDAAAGE